MHKVISSKATYTARNVIVATGFYYIPNYLKIPGEELPKVAHYYNNPHSYSKQQVEVVEDSNSA